MCWTIPASSSVSSVRYTEARSVRGKRPYIPEASSSAVTPRPASWRASTTRRRAAVIRSPRPRIASVAASAFAVGRGGDRRGTDIGWPPGNDARSRCCAPRIADRIIRARDRRRPCAPRRLASSRDLRHGAEGEREPEPDDGERRQRGKYHRHAPRHGEPRRLDHEQADHRERGREPGAEGDDEEESERHLVLRDGAEQDDERGGARDEPGARAHRDESAPGGV